MARPNVWQPLNSPPLFTPEFRLLGACAWLDEPNWPAQRSLVLSLLTGTVNPIEFHTLVKRHRVPALAYAVLTRAVGDAGVQAEWIRRLRPSACHARLRTLALAADWQRIVKLCHDAAIPIRPLKGTSLSARLYGDAGMRHARDIDLLVAPDDVERLLDLLYAEGYKVDHGMWPQRRGSALFRISRLVEYHITCRAPAGSTIEVHSQIERPWSSTVEPIWAAAAWDGGPDAIARFDLLYCALHGCIHGWSRLKWLGDLRVMVARVDENEWPRLIGLARELRLQSLLAGTLLLLDWITGFALPAPAAALVEHEAKAARRLAHHASEWMTMPEPALNRPTLRNSFRRWQLEWQVDRRLPLRENAPYWLAKLLLSPTDLQTIELTPPLAILYPVIRPFSTLGRGIAAMASRAR